MCPEFRPSAGRLLPEKGKEGGRERGFGEHVLFCIFIFLRYLPFQVDLVAR